MKKQTARAGLVLLVCLLLWFLYSTFCQGTNVLFQSSDGNWADRENLSKGRAFFAVVFLFESYKIKCNAVTTLQRTTKRPTRGQWSHWFNDYSDPKWKISYNEPYPHTASGNYRSKKNGQCARKVLTTEESARAKQLAVKFIDGLAHNKSFKFVPALRASTGHKNAAQFYAA